MWLQLLPRPRAGAAAQSRGAAHSGEALAVRQVPGDTPTAPQPVQVYLAPASWTGTAPELVVPFSVRRISSVPLMRQYEGEVWYARFASKPEVY